MGRNKISMDLIQTQKERQVCFKKRRIGAVKKLMQLSVLTGCKIELKIYLEEDHSLLEYRSCRGEELEHHETTLDSYLNLENKDYETLNSAEMSITRTYGSGVTGT